MYIFRGVAVKFCKWWVLSTFLRAIGLQAASYEPLRGLITLDCSIEDLINLYIV